MADTNDLLNYALDKNPVEFANTFDAILRQKAVQAIEDRRIEIAQSIYAPEEEQQFEPEYTEDDLDELDVDVEDFEDIDLDDIDDLDDLDEIDTLDGEETDG